MRKKLIGCLLLLCSGLLYWTSAQCLNTFKYNTIRVAYYIYGTELGWGDANANAFLQRAQAAGYNYVLGEFAFTPGSHIADLKDPIRKAYQQVATFRTTEGLSMRFIPGISMDSRWLTSWEYIKKDDNPNIEMNRILVPLGDYDNTTACSIDPSLPCNSGIISTPCFAPDPAGIDQSVNALLTTILAAHRESGVGYNFEFIGLGEGEMFSYEAPAKILIAASSPKDQAWIASNRSKFSDLQTTYQALLVNALKRRVDLVHNVLGPWAKIMIFGGDMWDPQLNGPIALTTFDNQLVKMVPSTTSGLATLPGLSSSDKAVFRSSIIIIPWDYGPPPPYDPMITFNYLNSYSLNFMHCSAYSPPADDPGNVNATQAMNNYVSASRNFTRSYKGFVAATWVLYPSDQFGILEALPAANTGYIPTRSFACDIPGLKLLLK